MRELIIEAANDYIETVGYELSPEQKEKVVKTAAQKADIKEEEKGGKEEFLLEIETVMEDEVENAIDDLNFERYPISDEEKEALNAFLSKGEFLKSPGHHSQNDNVCYLWEDFDEVNNYVKDNPSVKMYTLFDDGGKGYIVPGKRLDNRISHLVTYKETGFIEGDAIRFW